MKEPGGVSRVLLTLLCVLLCLLLTLLCVLLCLCVSCVVLKPLTVCGGLQVCSFYFVPCPCLVFQCCLIMRDNGPINSLPITGGTD